LSTATVIDMWTNYDEAHLLQSNNIKGIFYNNLVKAGVKDRVTDLVGDSKDILIDLLKHQKTFDLIYVDGSHKCLDCYNDMALAWGLLSPHGILAVDDYHWRPNNIQNEYLDRPYYAVNHFIERYKNDLEIFSMGYRVFLRKISA